MSIFLTLRNKWLNSFFLPGLIFLFACNHQYQAIPDFYHPLLDTAINNAGDNASNIMSALNKCPKEQREGMAFLISYMPEQDLVSLSDTFLLENAHYAYKARNEFPWCSNLPDSIFFNEVLPYANISEDRDPWRKAFYERFSKYVKDKDNIIDAIFAINRNIEDEVGVEYNTERSRSDAGPKQSMEEHMATCTGLSILLTDAFRSVGIPSRLAGTAMWTNMRGNHTWSEVLIGDEWMFTEYNPDTLNKSWFVRDAGKADPENKIHWIYAASYKPTDVLYPVRSQFFNIFMEMDTSELPDRWKRFLERRKNGDRKPEKPYIFGHNVTQRYIDIYQELSESNPLEADELDIDVVLYKSPDEHTSKDRVSCRVEVYEGERLIDFGYSPVKTDDANRFLNFRIKKNTQYRIILKDPALEGKQKEILLETGQEANEVYKLFLR
ncbi:transglutaminase domain-containing protein [Bacteroidota bacterium]